MKKVLNLHIKTKPLTAGADAIVKVCSMSGFCLLVSGTETCRRDRLGFYAEKFSFRFRPRGMFAAGSPEQKNTAATSHSGRHGLH